MHAITCEPALHTERRMTHIFVIDAPGYPRPLYLSDAAINIYPTLEEKRDIVQNAIDLAHALGLNLPKVAILSAIEMVTEKIRSTLMPPRSAKWPIGDRSPAEFWMAVGL